MLTFIVSISFAQYTPMTAAGYQFKRILCDSTLHIPSFCGVPTLRNSSAKNGAIAMDTCNFKIYMWTNAVGWGEIIGAGTDTTSLSVRIDQRVKYTDTAFMLSKYLRIIDTTNKFVANVTKVNDSTIRVFKGSTITDLKILGKGTDTTSLSNRIDARVKFTDTAAMLLPYLRKVDTTAMLSKYLRKTDTASLSNRINLKLNISDTATMLSKYLRKTDTTNRFVNAVTKVNDSTIRVFKGSTSTDIELPRGSGGGGGTGTVFNVSTGYGLSGGPINTTGNIIVDSAVLSTKYLRRADTSNLVATKSNLALKLNISDTATMLSKYLRKVDTASLSNRINLKLNISDTATMLSKYLRKVDTASLSNRINLKVNISDTATMLSKYLRKTDTVSLSNRINLKLNISDTATMLSNYLRKIDTTNKFVNNVTKINDTSFRVWKGTTSSVLAFAKDVVYTQSPIMSKVSNDSNIIYFNADTANAWRGGGSGTTPSLQDVATIGNTYSNDFADVLTLNSYTSGGDVKHPISWTTDPFGGLPGLFLDFSYAPVSYHNNAKIRFGDNSAVLTNGYIELTDEYSFLRNENSNRTIVYNTPYASNNTQVTHFPLMKNGIDTLATLEDVRNSAGGGGGSGTVTSVATGYGLSGGTITNTGTLIADTSESGLSGKYVRITDTATMLLPYLFGSGTANYVPKFSTTRQLAISQIFDNGTSVGISTSTPNASWKLDVNGIINTNNGVNIATNGAKTGFYGASNTMDIWAGNNKIATYGLVTTGGSAYDHFFDLNFGGGVSGTVNSMRIASSIVPNGNNSVDFNQLIINPSYNQTPVSGTGTGVLRGIYYNPTLTSLGTSKHIAFQSTSGDIIFNKLKTSSSTYDSIAIFVNDTLKKAPYPTVAGVSSGYYGAFEDTLSQTITSTTTAYPLNFRVTDLSNGVSVVNNNRILFANAGIYNLQYSAQFTNSSTSTEVGISVWIRKNGVDVAGSTGYIQLPKKGSGLNGETLPSWNFVLSLAAGDSIVWYWRADNTAASITSFAAGTSPTRPSTASTILTVTQQSGIMAGTGITGLGTSGNIQTGATQTLATGTSGYDFNISSSSNTQTFNLPNASSSNRGALLAADWTTFNNKIGAADTSVFQRKSISSYTMLANNTNATGNATAQTFRDTAGTYAGTIAWNGTAPTTQTINKYQWQQTGKMVRLQLFGYYTNAGVGCSAVSLTIPADCPAPDISMFTSGATAILYTGTGGLGLSNTSLTTTTNAYMRRNTGNTDNELYITAAGANYRRYQIDITYRAQ